MERKSSEQQARIMVNRILCEPSISYLMSKLKKHDDPTFVHCTNVAYIAAQIAINNGMSKKDARVVAISGLLHDIGKLEIPPELLNKAGQLNEKEYARIKEHCVKGFHIIEDYPGIPMEAKDVVLHHHERMDGSGYPEQIDGERLSIYVRIIGLSDVYDAMTSKRTYGHEYSSDCAIQSINALIESEFDSDILDVLRVCIDK